MLNRVGLNNDNVTFKSRYPVQGKADILGEICGYLKNKKAKGGFDFLDIRIEPVKKSYDGGSVFLLDSSGKAQKVNCSTHSDSIILFPANLDNTKDITKIDGLINEKPIFYKSTDNEPIDIFITGQDKEAFLQSGGPLDKIMKKTFENDMDYITGDQLGFLILKRNEIRENILRGNPVTNLAGNIVKQFVNFGKPLKEVVLDAKDVFENIQKGRFDIEKGLCLNA